MCLAEKRELVLPRRKLDLSQRCFEVLWVCQSQLTVKCLLRRSYLEIVLCASTLKWYHGPAPLAFSWRRMCQACMHLQKKPTKNLQKIQPRPQKIKSRFGRRIVSMRAVAPISHSICLQLWSFQASIKLLQLSYDTPIPIISCMTAYGPE